MTSSSIQDVSGIYYARRTKGTQNGTSDTDDISGMFQNAMNMAKNQSVSRAADQTDAGKNTIQSDTKTAYGMTQNVSRTYPFSNSQKIKEIEQDFENVVQSWNIVSGQSLSISYGYATGEEFPNLSLSEMAKIADKRMYSSKARFYADKGVDRRMQARSGEEFSKENKMVSDRRE